MGFWDFLNSTAGADRGLGSVAVGGGLMPDRKAKIIKKPALDRTKIWGMDRDKFSQFAGSLGNAIAPDTIMGRVGKTSAAFATQNIARRDKERLRLEGYKREDDKTRKKWSREDTETYLKNLREDKLLESKLKREKPGKDLTMNINKARLKKYKEAGLHQRRIAAYRKDNRDATEWEAEQAVARINREVDGKTKEQQEVADRKRYYELSKPYEAADGTIKQRTPAEVRRIMRFEKKFFEDFYNPQKPKAKAKAGIQYGLDDVKVGGSSPIGAKPLPVKKPIGSDFLKTNLGTYSGLKGGARLLEKHVNKPLRNIWGASTRLGQGMINVGGRAGKFLLEEYDPNR